MAVRGAIFDCGDDGARDVSREYRLEPGMAAAHQRECGGKAGDSGELVEKIVFRAEQDRGSQNDGRRDGREYELLAGRFRARIKRGRLLVRADRRDVDHACAEGRGCERDCLGAEGLHRIEFLPPALEQDADKIDHHVGVARGRFDGGRIAHIGLHGVDLADPSERLQVAGKFGPAHRDANAVAELGQRAYDMAAEESRAAKDGDQGFEGDGGHVCSIQSGAEYRIALTLYSAALRPFDKLKRGSLSI